MSFLRAMRLVAGAAGLATAGILLVAQSRCVAFGLTHTHSQLKACSENACSLQALRDG
jgi:hypothetical protein